MPRYKMANSLLRNTVCLTMHVTQNWSRMTQPISLGFRCSRICPNRNGSLVRGGKGEELISITSSRYTCILAQVGSWLARLVPICANLMLAKLCIQGSTSASYTWSREQKPLVGLRGESDKQTDSPSKIIPCLKTHPRSC